MANNHITPKSEEYMIKKPDRNVWAQGDSVAKVLASQAQEPEFGSPEPV